MNLTLSQLFTHLLSVKNFYAMVANRLKRVMVPGIGTMGVSIRDGRIVLLVDPEFVTNVSLPFGILALEHELGHVIWDHISRYYELLAQLPIEGPIRDRAHSVYQIAMDCAVNTLLRNDKSFPAAQEGMQAMAATRLQVAKDEGRVPQDEELDKNAGLILPEHYGLPEEGSFEFYMLELMKSGLPHCGKQTLQLFDLHALWHPSQDSGEGGVRTHDELQGLAEQIRGQVKQVLRDSVRECSQARGTVPSECIEWLGEFLAEPIIPWWDLLSTRVQATKRMKYTRNVSRPNRSLMVIAEEDPSILPVFGLEQDSSYRIFFFADTSGSMSSDSLCIAISELTHLLRADDEMEVRYMQGDAEVHFDEVYHTGDTIPAEVVGRGGTDFDAYFEYMGQYIRDDETRPGLVIVYTDGYAPELDRANWLPPEIPVIWLLTPMASAPENYGEIVICDPEQNHLHKEE